ncbi:MAG: hypothetical protein ACP5SH_13140, partial [Syntrophobacteraceae bacterium]
MDIHVSLLEKMYRKRLSGYAAIGYRAKADILAAKSAEIIFDNTDFLPVYRNDMMRCARQMVIVSPFVTERRVARMLPDLASLAERVS